MTNLFNDSQQYTYLQILNKMTSQLEVLFEIASINQQSKNAFFFMVGVCLLKDTKVTTDIVNQIYPGEKFHGTQVFFINLNKMLSGKFEHGQAYKMITDQSLFPEQGSIAKIAEHCFSELTLDLKVWIYKKEQKKEFASKDLLLLYSYYYKYIPLSANLVYQGSGE